MSAAAITKEMRDESHGRYVARIAGIDAEGRDLLQYAAGRLCRCRSTMASPMRLLIEPAKYACRKIKFNTIYSCTPLDCRIRFLFGCANCRPTTGISLELHNNEA